MEKLKYPKRVCKWCKKFFNALCISQKYCCAECKRQARNQQNVEAGRRFRDKQNRQEA